MKATQHRERAGTGGRILLSALIRAAMTWTLCSSLAAGCTTEDVPRQVDGQFIWPDGGQLSGADTSSTCNAANCLGCCQDNICYPGSSTDRCGVSGASCASCQAQETCSSGVCAASTCDAVSCPGGCCSASNTCLTGDTSSACGNGGATCQTCGADESCTQQTCKVKDPGLKTYTVIASKADITNSGTAFCNAQPLVLGVDGQCDVYLNVKSGSSENNTNTIKNTSHPQWNKTLFSVKGTDLKAGLAVKVYDDDPGPVNPRICLATYKVTDTDLTSGLATFDCSAGGARLATLHFKLVTK
jgi:hypothetical protein